MPNEPVISLENVSFAYRGVPVVENASFAVHEHETACMVGPNGGGKTTLIKLILGLLQPDRGRLRIFGLPPERARLRIGYMPQHIQCDFQFPVTVMDIVLMGRLGGGGLAGLFGWHGRNDRRAALEALGDVGMDSFVKRPFRALSGGQRQRVLIARALCSQPDLLVLDEPTANVDTLLEAKLLDILHELNRRMTILLVSHDLGFVSGLVRKVICVNRRVIMHPTGQLTGDAIREIYGADMQMVHHHRQREEPTRD